MYQKLITQILRGLPREPRYEDFFRIEEEIAARARVLAEELNPAGLASVVATVLNDYRTNVDRGFAEGDTPEDIANHELEMAVLERVVELLKGVLPSLTKAT